MQKMRNILFLLLDTTQSSIFWQLSLTMSRHAVKVRNQEEGTHILTDKYIVDVYCTRGVKSVRVFDGSKSLKIQTNILSSQFEWHY